MITVLDLLVLFLRIEYYHPNDKYRIKAILEGGFYVPRNYHPRYELYHKGPMKKIVIDPKQDEGKLDTKRLCFRCYEAHVPYTMQVFKDWNLAGMKAVKINGGKFRIPLPVSLKRISTIIEQEEHDNHTSNPPYSLLQESIESRCIWKKMTVKETKHEIHIEDQEDRIIISFKVSKLITNIIRMGFHKNPIQNHN